MMYAAVVSDRYCDVNTSSASTNCLANPMASPAVFDTVKATTAGFGVSSDSSAQLVDGFCGHKPRRHALGKSRTT